MATKKPQKPASNMWEKAKWQGFVNVRLDESEKKQVKQAILKEEDGLEFLMNAATAGYKCSISYSIPEEVFTVSLTGQYKQKPNGGVTMSIRHVDLMTAITALAWCQTEAGADGEWAERWTMSGGDNW